MSDVYTSTFAQATAAQYLQGGRMPARLANVRKVYSERVRGMGAALKRERGDAVEFTQPQGGLFFWARLTGKGGKVKDAGEFAKRAIEQGVAFVPGAPFYAKDPDVATFRLSFATADLLKIEERGGKFGEGGLIFTRMFRVDGNGYGVGKMPSNEAAQACDHLNANETTTAIQP